jgi:chromosome segregation ATPase
MAASEMVVNQAAKIAMLEKMIADCQADNKVLKNELTLTTQALTQTNIAFDELQNQMISVTQQNRSLKVKFEELADTYSRSETEIQQMLNQLRKYVSNELNAANVSSGSPSTNQMVEPGALPNSELLPSPKN